MSKRNPKRGSKGKPGGAGKRNQGKGAEVSADNEGITIGYEKAGAGIEIKVGPEVAEITLGIGIAAVTLDLTNINNSSISYAFDLYEIDGRQEGCNLIVDFSIAGQLVKTEVRELPECKEEEDEKENDNSEKGLDEDKGFDEDGFDGEEWDDGLPNWKPYDLVIAIISYGAATRKITISDYGEVNTFTRWYKLGYFDKEGDYYIKKYDVTLPSKIVAAVINDEGYIENGIGPQKFYPFRGRYSNFQNTKRATYEDPYIFSGHLLGLVGPLCRVKAIVTPSGTRVKISCSKSKIGGVSRYVCTRTTSNSEGKSEQSSAGSGNYSFTGKYQRKIIWSVKLESTYWPRNPGSPADRMPKTNQNCCKEIKQIHRALGVKELLDNKFYAPGRLIAPNAHQQQKMETYLDVFKYLIQAQDHLGVHPFKIKLNDANPAKAGNQEIEAQFVSGTAAMRKVVELLLENKGDAAARLNLQVRSAVTLVQILQVVTIVSKSVSNLISFVGMPFQEKVSTIRTQFDISLGQRKTDKGFDPKKAKDNASKEIQINEEAATEEILPEFLNSADHPYVHPKFSGKFLTLIELMKGVNRNG